MVNMPNVLGMRLEDALAECRAQGVEPEIVMTLPPKGRDGAQKAEHTLNRLTITRACALSGFLER